jgi:hypothetical protein
MKIITTLLLCTLFGITALNAKTTCTNNITLVSQQDIDQFSCEIIDGNLTLEINENLNLEPLHILKMVSGNLIIKFTPQIQPDLRGLRNLTSASGLYISSNGGSSWDSYIDISPLESLSSLNYLRCSEVTLKKNLSALIHLDSAYLETSYFQDVSWLNNIGPLTSLGLIAQPIADQNEVFISKIGQGGSLLMMYSNFNDPSGLKDISHLQRLQIGFSVGQSFDGLTHLQTAGHAVIVNNHISGGCCGLVSLIASDPNSSNLEFHDNSCTKEEILDGCLQACSGDILLVTQDEVNNFRCRTIEGNLTLRNQQWVDISPLKILKSISGDLEIRFSPTDYSGFSNLEYIGNELSIFPDAVDYNDPIDLNSFASLKYVRSISFSRRSFIGKLSALEGRVENVWVNRADFGRPDWLPHVVTIDTLRIWNINPENQINYGMNDLVKKLSENGFLQYRSTTLENFQGLEGRKKLGELNLAQVNVKSFIGTDSLEELTNLIIDDEFTSLDACGLQHLLSHVTITGKIEIPPYFIELMKECEDPCPGCEDPCAGSIFLRNQDDIDHFNCKTVQGDLTLRTDGLLVDTSPLQMLDSVMGDLTIDVTQTDHFGFSNLEYIGNRLYVNSAGSSNELFNLSTFSSLTHVRQIDLDRLQMNGQLNVLQDSVESVNLYQTRGFSQEDWMPLVNSVDTLSMSGGGTLRVGYNPGINPVLQRLSMAGHFFAESGFILNDLSGLKGKLKLGGIHINNLILNTFNGVESLTEIVELEITGVTSYNYTALCNLLTNGQVTGSFIFQSNSSELNEVIEGCSAPCDGDYFIYTQGDVDEFSCKTLEGNLEVRNRVSIETTKLLQLDSIKGSLKMEPYQALYSGFNNLKFIGDGLYIGSGLIDLASFSGLQHVRRIMMGAYASTSGQLSSLNDSLELVHLEASEVFNTSNWLPNVPHIDSLYLNWLGAENSGYVDILPKLGVNSFLFAEYTTLWDLNALTGKKKLGGIRFREMGQLSFEGLEDLHEIGILELSHVYSSDYCGLYTLFSEGTIGELIFENNTFTVDDILSNCVPETSTPSGIYPNPVTNGTVTVNWTGDSAKSTRIQVIDNFGKMVYETTLPAEEGMRQVMLDVSRLAGSIFLIRIITGENMELRRLVKN